MYIHVYTSMYMWEERHRVRVVVGVGERAGDERARRVLVGPGKSVLALGVDEPWV